jgi:hypothetical protein
VIEQITPDQLCAEAALLEESCPAGAVPEVCRRGSAEALARDRAQPLAPRGIAFIQPLVDQQTIDTALAQLGPDAYRTVATCRTHRHVLLDVARVALQSTRRKRVEHRLDDLGRGFPARAELAPQLRAGVLACGEQADGSLLDRRIQPAQTSASASSSAPAAAGKALARICASISAAICGLSLRNCRALSLPWPMRSPL